MIKILLVSSILTVWISEFHCRQAQAQAQVIWGPDIAPKVKSMPVIWENIFKPSKDDRTKTNWKIINEQEDDQQPSSTVIWEVLNPDELMVIPHQKKNLI